MRKSKESRDLILNKIYDSLNKKNIDKIFNLSSVKDLDNVDNIYEHLFNSNSDELDIMFAKEFSMVGGRFVYCADEESLFVKLKMLLERREFKKLYCAENRIIQKLNNYNLEDYIFSDLENCDASITSCEFLIARTGSIFISSFVNGDRASSAYAPVHICVAYNYQLVYDIAGALSYYKRKYAKNLDEFPSFFSLITGPSKTSDIEKTLVKGGHGPDDIYVFFVDK